LFGVATTVFDELEKDGGFGPVDFAHERARWTAGLVDAHPAGLLRAWLDAECDLALPVVPIGIEVPIRGLVLHGVELSGRIDRIDRVPGGLLVTDYKTGQAPSTAQVRQGLALQPILYAAAAARAHREAPVVSTFQELRKADGVRKATWAGDPDLLDSMASSRDRVPVDRAAMNNRLEAAAQSVRRLLAGQFHPTLADPADVGCPTCDFRFICRTDAARAQRIRSADGDWQRPLPP
jgi:hypothetical protein